MARHGCSTSDCQIQEYEGMAKHIAYKPVYTDFFDTGWYWARAEREPGRDYLLCFNCHYEQMYRSLELASTMPRSDR